MSNPEDNVASVLDPALRRPFSLLIALGVIVMAVVFSLSKAESFVDGRIELKMSASRERADEQELKLSKMEEQFAAMRDTLSEIRVDVRVLRARVEGADSQRDAIRAPASAAPVPR